MYRFPKLVACVCNSTIGALFCIKASRSARNGRDCHRLVEPCTLVGALVIGHDGVYDLWPVNDRLLLELRRTMSE